MNNWTFEKLYKSTINFKQWRRNYSHNKKIGISKIIPYVATKSVLFQVWALGHTQKVTHRINLLFNDVEILKELPKDKTLFDYFKITNGTDTYYIRKIDPFKCRLSVRCTCADFFYSFSLWNYQQNCLFGPKPRPYKRKTRSYPERNPQHIPGICKHIYNSYVFLRVSGYTVEQGVYK